MEDNRSWEASMLSFPFKSMNFKIDKMIHKKDRLRVETALHQTLRPPPVPPGSPHLTKFLCAAPPGFNPPGKLLISLSGTFSPLILFRLTYQRGGGPHTTCPSPAQRHLHNAELLAVAFEIQRRTHQAFAGLAPSKRNPLGQPGSFKALSALSVLVHCLQNIISRTGAWLLQK